MFKNLKTLVMLGLGLTVLVIIFFIFYVPGGSVEGRVNGLSQIFNRKESADISFELVEYLGAFEPEERAEIFNMIPFKIVKENPELLIAVFDESYPGWKELNSFNSNYLMTEVELIAKQNASPIKNTEPIKLKVSYNDLAMMSADIKSIFSKVWNIDDRSVFVLDNTLKCEMRVTRGETRVLNLEVEVFDIKTGYVFHLKYSGEHLEIKPENRKVEDDGAFELSEKIGVYDYRRLKSFISSHFKLSFEEYSLLFDDSFIDKKISGNENEESTGARDGHLDVIIYSDLIKILDLDKDKNVSYAGSMRFRPISSVKKSEQEGEAGQENPEGKENQKQEESPQYSYEKEISLNLFKADW